MGNPNIDIDDGHLRNADFITKLLHNRWFNMNINTDTDIIHSNIVTNDIKPSIIAEKYKYQYTTYSDVNIALDRMLRSYIKLVLSGEATIVDIEEKAMLLSMIIVMIV